MVLLQLASLFCAVLLVGTVLASDFGESLKKAWASLFCKKMDIITAGPNGSKRGLEGGSNGTCKKRVRSATGWAVSFVASIAAIYVARRVWEDQSLW